MKNDLTELFEKDTPIFIEEMLEKLNAYSKQYAYRLINDAKNSGILSQFDRGIYYIPKDTFFGKSVLNLDQVVEKKYVCNNEEVYGVYCGLALLNRFGITTQVPNNIEVITNKEATRKRIVCISNEKITIRKSRCTITKDNCDAYTLLQLFNDMDESDVIDDLSAFKIESYIEKKKIKMVDVMKLIPYFPCKVSKRLLRSEIVNGLI